MKKIISNNNSIIQCDFNDNRNNSFVDDDNKNNNIHSTAILVITTNTTNDYNDETIITLYDWMSDGSERFSHRDEYNEINGLRYSLYPLFFVIA